MPLPSLAALSLNKSADAPSDADRATTTTDTGGRMADWWAWFRGREAQMDVDSGADGADGAPEPSAGPPGAKRSRMAREGADGPSPPPPPGPWEELPPELWTHVMEKVENASNCDEIERECDKMRLLSHGMRQVPPCDTADFWRAACERRNFTFEDGFQGVQNENKLVQWRNQFKLFCGLERASHTFPAFKDSFGMMKKIAKISTVPDFAFSKIPEMRFLTHLPHNINSIGSFAFFESGVAFLVLPPRLTSVGDNAFTGCANFQCDRLPDSLTNLGYACFRNCTSLVLPLGMSEFLLKIPNECFAGCTKLNIPKLPDALERLGDDAFAECESLTLDGQFLPPEVRYINRSCFYGCENLGLRLGPTVRSVDSYAFWNCSSLQSIAISDLLEVGIQAFDGCTSLKVDPEYNSFERQTAHFKERAFRNCKSLVLGDAAFAKLELNNQTVDYPRYMRYADGIFDGGHPTTVKAWQKKLYPDGKPWRSILDRLSLGL